MQNDTEPPNDLSDMKRSLHHTATGFGLLAALLFTTSCNRNGSGTFQGVIEASAPGSVTVRRPTDGTRVRFLLDGADTSRAYGLVCGNRITVQYRGSLRATTPARHVAANPTYARAVGRWGIPDPSAPDSVMGVQLLPEGEAQSMRLKTIRYTSWEVAGRCDTLLLHGTCTAADSLQEFSQRAHFSRDSLGREALQLEGGPIVLNRH